MPARSQFFVNPDDPEDTRSNNHRNLFMKHLRSYEDDAKVFESLDEEVFPTYLRLHNLFSLIVSVESWTLHQVLDDAVLQKQLGAKPADCDELKQALEVWARNHNIYAPWMISLSLLTMRLWADDVDSHKRRVIYKAPETVQRLDTWLDLTDFREYMFNRKNSGKPSSGNSPARFSVDTVLHNPLLATLRQALLHYREEFKLACHGLQSNLPKEVFDGEVPLSNKSSPGWFVEDLIAVSQREQRTLLGIIGFFGDLTEYFAKNEVLRSECCDEPTPFDHGSVFYSGMEMFKEAFNYDSSLFFVYAPHFSEQKYKKQCLDTFGQCNTLAIILRVLAKVLYDAKATMLMKDLESWFENHLDSYMSRCQAKWQSNGYKREMVIDEWAYGWFVKWNVLQMKQDDISDAETERRYAEAEKLLASRDPKVRKKADAAQKRKDRVDGSTLRKQMGRVANMTGIKRRQG